MRTRARGGLWSLALTLTLSVAACGRDDPAPEQAAPADTLADILADTLTSAEQQAFAPDPLRYPEMQGGRLDTVDMEARAEDAAWHVQAVNYTPAYAALTYAAWYTGPDSVTLLAADGQPRLVDDLGNVYRGVVVPGNPRLSVASGTTAVGVYVFQPGVVAEAESLTLFVNDSTAPVFRIGPFGVRHDATGSLSPVESGAGSGVELETN